jgi:hypothetical protein
MPGIIGRQQIAAWQLNRTDIAVDEPERAQGSGSPREGRIHSVRATVVDLSKLEELLPSNMYMNSMDEPH